jgi:hypothetical protein
MQAQQFVGGNYAASKAGLTGLSGAATTMTTAAAILFAIGGKAFSKAAIAAGATPTVDAVTGAAITLATGKGTNILWCLDAAGNVRLVQGSVENVDASGKFAVAPPQFANLPDTLAPFAYSIHTNTGAAFTIGVSLWNQAGATHAVQDILTVPSRPQLA